MKYYIYILVCLISFSCSKNKNVEKINFDNFTIVFENVAVQKKEDKVILNKLDTLHYVKGININSLTELDPKIVYLPKMTDSIAEREKLESLSAIPNVRIVRTKYYDLDDFREQNVVYEKIDDKDIKITMPRSKKGITGFYLDSLSKGSQGDVYGKISLSLHGKNLSDESREAFLEAIETLNFKN